MKQKGIAPLIIVVVIVVAVIVAGLGTYIIVRGDGGPSGLPVYPGATSSTLPAEYGAFASADTSAFTISENTEKVADWYGAQMPSAGWTEITGLLFDNTILLVYSKGDELAVILVTKGVLIVAQGTTTVFQQIDQSIPELTIPTVPLPADATVSGSVFDWDATAAESYKNGSVFITAQVTSGGLRNVGDPTYGFLVTLTNPRTGKTYYVGLGAGNNDGNVTSAIDNYGKVITLVKTFPNVSGSDDLVITLRMSPNTAGTLAVGSAITIDMRIGGTYPDQTTEIWKDRDTINVVISGRDSITKTGYDGAYLLGIAYTA